MKTINISKNRVSVDINNHTIQFVCWDLREDQHEEIESQLNTAFNLTSTFSGIEKHMKLNGFELELEDIY